MVEVVGGVLPGSLALLADAGHKLTGVAGTGLALLAVSSGQRPVSTRRSFGHHRRAAVATWGT